MVKDLFKFIIAGVLLWGPMSVFSQEPYAHSHPKFNTSLSLEILPLGQGFSESVNGVALTFDVEPTLHRWHHSITLGFNFENFSTGEEVGSFSLGGRPITEFSTEIDKDTQRPYPYSWVQSKDLEALDNLGWARFKTQSSYRFNRYLSYQVIYAVPLAERWTVKGGGGLMGGLTVRQDTPSTFLSNVRPLLSKEEQELIIKLHTRAKYLFFGLASKINVEYTLSPKWAVGMGGNFHYIFNRNFEEDVKIVFLSLYGKVAL